MATIFSKIVAGEIPSYKVAEDEKHYQIFPLDDHSWLTVIPKNRHSHQLELKKTLETSDPRPLEKEKE